MDCRPGIQSVGAHGVKQDEHWVRDVAGWAYIFLAMVVVVLPFQAICEAVPLTLDEMAKEISKQLDEAVKELANP